MPLRFIIGSAGSGKTHRCMEEIVTAQQKKQGRQVYIVPEQFTSQAEHDLIVQTGTGAILSAEVLSFGRLAHQFFAKEGMGERRPLEEIGKNMALQKILLQEKENVTYFRHVMDKSGFVDQLGLTISEFFQYRMQPEALRLRAEDAGLSVGIQEKLADLATLFQAYLDFLEQDYLSADETLSLFSEGLAKIPLYQDTDFWLDGFYSFTPQEFNVIQWLLRLSKSVTITLPMSKSSFLASALPPTSPFFPPFQTKTHLSRFALEEGIAQSPALILEENHRAATDALRSLEKNFFHSFSHSCSLSESVAIYTCPTRQEEITFAAGTITRLVRENGLRYRDIAIVTNAMDLYEKNLRGILREYKIPCFIDSRREIVSHPLITFVSALLDILVFDFRYENVFSYLKAGLAPFSSEEVDVLENYVLAYGIKGYKWKKDSWGYGMKKEGEDALALVNELRERFLAPFQPFLSLKQNQPYPLQAFLQLLLDHLSLLHIPRQLTQWAEEATKNGNPAKGEEHRQIWQMLMDVLEKAIAILGTEKMTLAACAKILAAGLAKCTMGIIPPTTDCLVVGDIERSRLAEIKVLFVLGVNEGVLPAPSLPQGIFTEAERRLLTETGMEMAVGARQKAFEEQFLIYRGLTRPSEKLFLTYAGGDAEGKAMFPSSLIDRLCRMDKGLSVHVFDGFSPKNTVPTAAFHHLGAQLRLQREGEELPAQWQDIFSFFAETPAWQKRLQLLVSGLSKNKKPSVLSPKTAKALYGKKIFSSVSRLERFAACPFSFFAEYGLKAKDRQLYQLHAPDLGSLFHEVLEIFSANLAAAGRDWSELTQGQTETLICQAVDDAAPRLGNEILLDTAANQYLIQRLKRISTRAAWTLVQHLQQGDFLPAGYEVGFGSHEALPPILIELAEGNQLILSGKIDRVDLLDAQGQRYAKIIDYKSGAKAFSFQDIYYGLQLQLLIYMDAYLKHHEKTEAAMKPGGVFYFRITDPTLSLHTSLSAEEISKALYEKMQMSGLLLDNDTVLAGIDQVFSAAHHGVSSAIVPVGFTKKGEPAATAYLADEEQYHSLLAFAVERAKTLGEHMQQGVIAPSPYRKGTQTPCAYCRFRSLCRSDYEKEPKWRDLQKIGKKNFWGLLEEPDSEN